MCAWYPHDDRNRGRGDDAWRRQYGEHERDYYHHDGPRESRGRRYDDRNSGYDYGHRGYDYHDRDQGRDGYDRRYEDGGHSGWSRDRGYGDGDRGYDRYGRDYDDRPRGGDGPEGDYDRRYPGYRNRDRDDYSGYSREANRHGGNSSEPVYDAAGTHSSASKSSRRYSSEEDRSVPQRDTASSRQHELGNDRETSRDAGRDNDRTLSRDHEQRRDKHEFRGADNSQTRTAHHSSNSSGEQRSSDSSREQVSRWGNAMNSLDSGRGSYVDSRERVIHQSTGNQADGSEGNHGEASNSEDIDNRQSNPDATEKEPWYKRHQGFGSRRNRDDSRDGHSTHGYDRPRRSYGDSKSDDNSATILVRKLPPTISAEDVESAVSDLCIQNGTSAPNAVTLKSCHSGYGGMNDMYNGPDLQHQVNPDGYGFGASTEHFAVVTFPSPANAARFMECVSSRKLELNGAEYYVEYDTLDVNAEKPVSEVPRAYANFQELEQMMKRKTVSCDWICADCRFVNFARRSACLTCDKPKPSDEQLQKMNLLVDNAVSVQSQPILSNVTDVSSWVVLKGIPMAADPSKLVLLVCGSVPEGAAHLQKCVYVIDPQPQSRRGFMFCQFSSVTPVNAFNEAMGDKLSTLLQFQDVYLRLDVVRSREKQVADELLKGARMNTLRVNYEYHSETFTASAMSDDPGARQMGNKEYRSCKVRTTNVGALEQLCQSVNAPSGAKQYLDAWMCKAIWVTGGKPDTTKMTYDPNSDYFYDHRLGVYYDAASGYYFTVGGEYYRWDEATSSLIVTAHPGSQVDQGQQDQTQGHVAGLLQAALKAAQMTNQIAQKKTQKPSDNILQDTVEKNPPPGMQEVNQTHPKPEEPSGMTNSAARPVLVLQPPSEVAKTFDLGDHSDDECDMEVDSLANPPATEKAAEGIGTIKKWTPVVKPLSVCLVCLRMFRDQAQLDLHERRSQYHQALLECGDSAS
ncbi:Suppressor of abi3-5 isoform 2 [Babesia ovata]|uniref:Suppressor of abi3-5 isoform 2 n=1 Tax=Babesia ovata TaxID=189622 RepID=A0A2H6K6J3_9APIC|nr:Suppressor of abi3-5 isoform 2 [Babesia ovata]GBE58614.1 Suppressor of abi3-5 isoform 2 [Babesia ovata]